MVVVSAGWILDVERGPDWLIVTLHCDHENEWDCPPLAETIWSLLQQHFTYRVVLDMSQVPLLHSAIVGQLVYLQKRVCTHDGVLRVCGLSERNHDVLRSCRLDGFLPHYQDRNQAVTGMSAPSKPR